MLMILNYTGSVDALLEEFDQAYDMMVDDR